MLLFSLAKREHVSLIYTFGDDDDEDDDDDDDDGDDGWCFTATFIQMVG